MSRTTIGSVKTSLLHEALQRAIKIAPTKGAGYDKAGGLLFEFHIDGKLYLKATDLERTFFQQIDCEVLSEMTFRIHTNVARFVASLPMTGEQEVRFHVDSATGRIEIQYMKSPTKIKVPVIVGEYPNIDWHQYDEMDDAFELASKLASVAWAIEDSASGVLSGVRMDGEWIEAMCSKQMARIQCKVSTTEPLIGVVRTLTPLIAQGSRVKVMAKSGRMIVALDEHSQVTTSTVLGNWPNLAERIDKLPLPNSFTVNRQRLLDALNRVTAFTSGDRFPRINFQVSSDRIVISLAEASDGDITDSITLTSQEGDPCDFVFQPVWLSRAVDTFPGGEIQVKYSTNVLPIRLIEPMTSYNALIMGLQPGENVESPKEES